MAMFGRYDNKKSFIWSRPQGSRGTRASSCNCCANVFCKGLRESLMDFTCGWSSAMAFATTMCMTSNCKVSSISKFSFELRRFEILLSTCLDAPMGSRHCSTDTLAVVWELRSLLLPM